MRDDGGSHREKKDVNFYPAQGTRNINSDCQSNRQRAPIVYVTRGSSSDEAFSLVCSAYTGIVRVVLAACRQLIKEFNDNDRERN